MVSKTKKQLAKNGTNSVIEYLKKYYTFRYNRVLEAVMFAETPNCEEEMRLFQNRDLANILSELAINEIYIERNELQDLIDCRLVSEDYDPFEEYFAKLPKWDGITDHYAEYLQQVTLEDEDQREQFVRDFKKWFIDYVGGLTGHGANDKCFVIVGEQGSGKTRFLTHLMPEQLRREYMAVSSYDLTNNKNFNYLAQKGLILLDDINALSRAEKALLKSMMVVKEVSVRRSYQVNETRMQRRASFIGASNCEYILNEENEKQRFIVYKIRRYEPDAEKKD